MRLVLVALGCNNTCLFCAQGALRTSEAPRGDLEADVVAAARSSAVVALVGGEPTLVPDLPDLIRLARSSGASEVILQTNGRRLAYVSYVKALHDAGLTGVEVSLHGSSAAMHDFHTGVPGSFAQTVTGLGAIRAAGVRVGVTTVVTRSNFRHLTEIVRLVHARGVRFLQFSLASPQGRAFESAPSLVPSPEMVSPYLTDAMRLGRSLGQILLVAGTPTGPIPPLFAGIGTTEPLAAGPTMPRLGRVLLPILPSSAAATRDA
jgi:MoaA/NifB/PqqE/SkfB family radical SAM enzyme